MSESEKGKLPYISYTGVPSLKGYGFKQFWTKNLVKI